jgi:hypothetical protein
MIPNGGTMKLRLFGLAVVVGGILSVAHPVAQDTPQQAPPAKQVLDAALSTPSHPTGMFRAFLRVLVRLVPQARGVSQDA